MHHARGGVQRTEGDPCSLQRRVQLRYSNIRLKFISDLLRNNFGTFLNSKNLKIEVFFLRFAEDCLLNLIVFHGDS